MYIYSQNYGMDEKVVRSLQFIMMVNVIVVQMMIISIWGRGLCGRTDIEHDLPKTQDSKYDT